MLTRDNVTLLMRGMAAEYNLKPEKIGTHSVRISGATALLQAGIPPATVQIIGRWVSNSFIGYTKIQSRVNERHSRQNGANSLCYKYSEGDDKFGVRPQGHLSRSTLFGDH